jgi:outer membrane protein OmpA-like peptidoglycan-associated protein
MKPSLLLSAILLLSIFSLPAFSQDREVEKLQHKKKHQVAHHLVDKGSYYNAIDHLVVLAKEHPKNKKYISKLADAYFLSRDYTNAALWYGKAVEIDNKLISSSLFKLAESQKYNGNYAEAKANFKTFFDSKYRDSRGEKYKIYAENEIESCEYALQHQSDTLRTSIKHLGDTINSAYTDFSPSMLDDSTLVFASLQADTVLTYRHDEVHFNHTKLYKSQLQKEEWTHPVQIEKVNTMFENNANGSLSADGKRFYFSRCFENLKHEMICHLYMSKIDEKGNFSKPKKLPSNINKGKFSYTQPVVANHKLDKGDQQEVLYFVSNKTGGKGGFDIWYTVMLPDNEYKNPINLGKEINTVRDEITPYYDSLSGNLYFSSNYHYGFGGYDIFRAKGQMITWTKPVNIGIPYNSNVDDTYYIFNKKQNKGFFVSNRVGGINLKSATCCDDIYGYTQPKPLLMITHTYDKASKALYKNATEIVFNKSSSQQNDTLKIYNALEGQYLYNKVIAKAIYKGNKGNGYAVTCIDSGLVIEQAFFNIDQEGNIVNTQVQFEKDSISATRIEDTRFDIVSINIFIHKDSPKIPIVVTQKAFDEKEKYFQDNRNEGVNILQNQQKDSVDNQKVAQTLAQEKVIENNKLSQSKPVPAKINTLNNTLQVVANHINDSIKTMPEQVSVIDTIKPKNKAAEKLAVQITDTLKIDTLKVTDKKINKHQDKKALTQKTTIHKLMNVKQSMLEVEHSFSNKTVDSLALIKDNSPEKQLTPVPDIEMIVHFEYNDPEFIAHHKKMLDSIADFLKANDHINLSVEAHTDNVGNKEYNLKLSAQRAKSIVAHIDLQGISKKRVLAKWFGENDPLVPNQNPDGSDNEQNRLENRRAELRFFYNKKINK